MSEKHDLTFNKLAASILMAGLLFMVIGYVADFLYTPENPEKRGFAIDVPEEGTETATEVVEIVDVGTLLQTGDATRGESLVGRKCASCHSFDAGGANKVGPNLHGVLGSKIANHAGYSYSAALSEKGSNWDYEKMNEWLADPQKFAKGTKMALKVKKDEERADIIMYLKSISPSAPAVPAPKPAASSAPAEESAPAEAATSPEAH
ncbi:MAG: cytochrome c family protein [Alphaproteobacteria bacterium CG11_big_fil_rev_8_21_14_0_20_44_7]|nr:MAG: cytochrome c family protein [Alphaproteobacteria bacterium CG11_big_fil_rev_8_21_14_0_20_44_7]